MTRQQSRLHAFIASYTAEHDGCSPSYADMMEAIGVTSRSAVHGLIVRLERHGHITRRPGHARSVRIVDRTCPACAAAVASGTA